MFCTSVPNFIIYKNCLLKLQKFYKHFLRHLFGNRGRCRRTIFVLYKLILYFLEEKNGAEFYKIYCLSHVTVPAVHISPLGPKVTLFAFSMIRGLFGSPMTARMLLSPVSRGYQENTRDGIGFLFLAMACPPCCPTYVPATRVALYGSTSCPYWAAVVTWSHWSWASFLRAANEVPGHRLICWQLPDDSFFPMSEQHPTTILRSTPEPFQQIHQLSQLAFQKVSSTYCSLSLEAFWWVSLPTQKVGFLPASLSLSLTLLMVDTTIQPACPTGGLQPHPCQQSLNPARPWKGLWKVLERSVESIGKVCGKNTPLQVFSFLGYTSSALGYP